MKFEVKGIGVLLTIVFAVLKLCGVIAWSWWWVLSPFWVPLALAGVLYGILALLRLFESDKAKAHRQLFEALDRLSGKAR